MSVRIRIVGLVDGRPSEVDGQLLRRCDVDAREGRGVVYGTVDPAKAMIFEGVADALEYWKRQSTVVPLRTDGKPNRPFTAYTVEVENI